MTSFAQESTQKPKRIVCSALQYELKLDVLGSAITWAQVWGPIDQDYQYPQPKDVSFDGVAQYEFQVDDSQDTNLFYDVYVQNGEVVKREVYMSGNDSDNYYPTKVAEGDDAFICQAK